MRTMSNAAGRFGVTIFLFALGAGSPALAQSRTVPVEGVGYRVDAPMAANLESLADRKITVTLDGGAVVTGRVKAVGKELLHLEKLDGKEYFDALIRIEEITAIDTRFREIQR